jgi:hypothetical protein
MDEATFDRYMALLGEHYGNAAGDKKIPWMLITDHLNKELRRGKRKFTNAILRRTIVDATNWLHRRRKSN